MSTYGAVKQNQPDTNPREFYGLPVYHERKGDRFLLDIANWNDDLTELYRIFEKIVADGQTYPQESTSLEEFRAYFYSHKTFVVRQILSDSGENSDQKVVGGFYIKPNFPGRSSHLANYGLIVDEQCRGRGIGNFMVENCIPLARKLGFKALYTNLVFETNVASIEICKRYGFQQVGKVPNGGNLKDLGFVAALQFYKDLS